MSPRIASVAACLLASSPASGFAPPPGLSSSIPTALSMASHAAEDSYPRLLASASLCANSESCSVESAELYLREIVHVQSGCAAGTLSGHDACDDVLGVSEVVAALRRKIADGAEREVRSFWNQRRGELESLAVASADGPAAALAAPLKPAYLAIAALYAMAVVALLHPGATDGGVVPFTAEEIWWAVRDGYAADLASHLFRNGGLAVGDAVASAGASLSPQELMWSIRDGYADDALFSAGAAGGVESAPFTPQEAWWAVRDGYALDMAQHWFRNGGLAL